MLVEILVELTDHRQRYFLGEIHELDEAIGAEWIRQGWAAAVGEADTEPETATVEPGPEQAVQPRPRRRKRST